MARLYVLDAMGLAYRAYYAFIRRPLTNSRGENTSAIFGFANTALKIRTEEAPELWALAWDGPGPTFRHERYPKYKATRKPTPDDLLSQIPAIEDLAHAIGLPILEVPGAEADDVMATLARRGEAAGHDVALVTSDKDMLQLVNDRVKLLSPTGRDEYAWIGREEVHEKWGVAPEQIRDVLALMGDSSDNIPGVPGIGEKTAKELIHQFGSIDAIYERLVEVTRPAVRRKLAEHREMAMLSRELVTVKTDLDLPVPLEALRCGPIRRDALAELGRQHEIVRFERLAKDLGVADAEAGPAPPARDRRLRGTTSEMRGTGVALVDDDAQAARAGPAMPKAAADRLRGAGRDPERQAPPARLRQAPATIPPPPAPTPESFDALADGPQGTLDLFAGTDGVPPPSEAARQALEDRLHEVRARAPHGIAMLPLLDGDARTGRLIGLALAARDGTACYVPLAHAAGGNLPAERVREWIGPMLADRAVPVLSLDLKRDLHALRTAGLVLAGGSIDLHLVSFLLDPERSHGLTQLARDLLGIELPTLDAVIPRGRARVPPSAFPAEATGEVMARRASVMPALADALRTQLEARDQWQLYERLEHPMIAVLVDMERAGISLDAEALASMSQRTGEEIEGLERELRALAGEDVNLQSGPQLAHVLFEVLGLEPGRKTKTGYSTDQAELERLAASHVFPARLLEYRALTKLRSTYLDALPAVIDPRDGRVHTTFHQAGAATGRLSSSNPNLQNIPMRTAQGREVRRAFVAAPGCQLIGADYSQIELRVMAHLSEDPNLIAAFESGEDVHASTARKVFGVTADALDPEMRARAKIVNFGVMYGMGARSLSEQMGLTLAEAREFISGYFRVYARVREYLDTTVEEARRSGFVATILGRRRYLPELGGSGGRRAMAERVAINTPIQGSAADLVKLAMLRVHAALKRFGPSARLLLQVHDELVIECAVADAEAVAETVKREMEGCFPLRVPLCVSLGRGASWFDVHA